MNSVNNNNNNLRRLRRHRVIAIAFMAIALAAILNFSLFQETNYVVVAAGLALLATSAYNYKTIQQQLTKHHDQDFPN